MLPSRGVTSRSVTTWSAKNQILSDKQSNYLNGVDYSVLEERYDKQAGGQFVSLETIELVFRQHLADDADISLSLGMENKLGELGDPSLQAHHQSCVDAKALLERISKEESAEDFYQQLDLHLIQLYLKRELFFKELSINGKLQRQQKPGGIDGVSAGIFSVIY